MIDDKSDIYEFLAFIAAKAVLLFVFAIVGAGIGFTIAMLQEPLYRAEAVAARASAAASPSGMSRLFGEAAGIADLAGIRLNSEGPLHALAILQSRAFTEDFIRKHRLLPIMYADLWSEDSATWIESIQEQPTVRDASQWMRRDIARVQEDSSSGLIHLTIDWTDPELAAIWANQMIEDLNEELREQALTESNNTIQYLKRELESTNILGVRDAVYGLMEQQLRQKSLANIRKEFALKMIDPAVAPSLEDRLRPRPFLSSVIGGILGFLVGLILLLGVRRSNLSTSLDC